MMKRKHFALALLCCAGLLGLCGCGTDVEPTDVLTATVYTDAQVDGSFVRPYGEITVSADAAENNGFADQVAPETAVSALDVMVALHEELYGKDFTADPAAYIGIDGGWINNAFDNSTDSVSVILNGESAHSDAASSYGGFEALTVDQTEVKDGDVIQFVSYQDTENYSDYALWLYADDEKVTSLDVASGSDVKLNVKGYTFSFYGAYGEEEITASYLEPMAGVELAVLGKDGVLSPLDGAVSDAEGNVTFALEEAGTYTVVAYLPEGNEAVSFMACLTVTVK